MEGDGALRLRLRELRRRETELEEALFKLRGERRRAEDEWDRRTARWNKKKQKILKIKLLGIFGFFLPGCWRTGGGRKRIFHSKRALKMNWSARRSRKRKRRNQISEKM